MKKNLPLLSLWAFSLFAEIPLTSLSLKQAENIAREYNKALLVAKEGTTQAQERKDQALSRWLPSLLYRAEFSDLQKKELFFNIFDPHRPYIPSHRGYGSILELSQPLFSADLFFNLKAKQRESEVVEWEQASTVNELLFAVRKEYYSVVTTQISLDIERENINYLSFALEQEQKKLEAGNSTPLEVNQSKVALSNAISLYYQTLQKLKTARNRLILALGIDPLLEPNMELSEKEIPLYSTPEIAFKLQCAATQYGYLNDQIPSTSDFLDHIQTIEKAKSLILFSDQEVFRYLELAVLYRPDLKARKLQIEVANENVKGKQGHYLPQINGYARYSYNDGYLGAKPFSSEKYYWSAGITLSWNLFDSFLREHEIREAKSVKQSTQIQYDHKLQKVEVEIRNGLYVLEEAIMAYLSSQQAVFVADQARCQAAEKLQFGKIPPLEYRDAVNMLLQSRKTKNEASRSLIEAYFDLRYAVGIDASI